METALRYATADDVPMLRLLAEKIWWPTYAEILSKEQIRFMLDKIYDEDKLRLQIENEEQTFLILSENNVSIGFTAFSADQENPQLMTLEKIYCLPEMQGKGYGKLLINTVETKAREAGKSILQLYVHRQNKARNFYEKLNFKVVKEVDRPLGKFLLTDFVMEKKV
ncbi:GNAT family N-acetyltransferase [uncultured Mucilaginibacter sp.]|uniref:GNAT family N-acetyltransferase n=1 Tax=uncultured Mucilaginibacter sp. TaxID=797541 RepID=UPI00261CA76C|nr:GNAT family N-acetyltransferase [uncultured Mucilaginibacter sp.]